MNKTGNFSKVQRMVILAVLIALTLVMALTPLGYLKIGALSIRHGNAFNQLVLHLYNLCCCTSSYGLVHRTYRKRSGQGI